jgi:hypothetical protein
MTTGDMIETEPGNTIGPVVQGFNTRFGSYSGPMNGMQSTYPPDVVVRQPVPPLAYDRTTDTITQSGQPITDGSQINFNYDNYTARVEGEQYDFQPAPNGNGAFQRREVAVAIGNCDGTTNGQGEVPLLGLLLSAAGSGATGQRVVHLRPIPRRMPRRRHAGTSALDDSGPLHHSAVSRLLEHGLVRRP